MREYFQKQPSNNTNILPSLIDDIKQIWSVLLVTLFTHLPIGQVLNQIRSLSPIYTTCIILVLLFCSLQIVPFQVLKLLWRWNLSFQQLSIWTTIFGKTHGTPNKVNTNNQISLATVQWSKICSIDSLLLWHIQH